MRLTKEMYEVDDRPGKGIYRCVEQPHWVVTVEDDERLPPVPHVREGETLHYERTVDLSTAVTHDEAAGD